MALESIPAVKGGQASVEKPDVALKKQLQQEGLRQAREFQQSSQATQVSVSQTRVASTVMVSSLEQEVVVGERRFDNERYDKAEENKSAFDFREVATNVLKFVGSVVRGAAKSGADEEKLTDLLGQARSGVAKGIALAEKDLAGFMNPQITDGIRDSKQAIGEGIDNIEKEVLSPFRGTMEAGAVLSSQYAESQSAGLKIRTRDGDEVEINFGQARQYQYSAAQQYSASAANAPVSGNESVETAQTSVTSQTSLAMAFTEYRGISFSVKGELDKDEVGAISDLIKQITDVSKSFFDGDLDSALDKALDLGYNDKELAGFALRLDSRQVLSEKISAYKEVSDGDSSELKQYMRPIKEYMDELKSLNELLDTTLKDGEGYLELVNGVINQMKEVHVPDVLSAINRFHLFNGRINAMKKEAE
ncbi:DUF5610 domain-containing protein [Alteromonas lipolytica]|uniref:DUF5610 domain-containing protein n=1 Tax=Alteromonas lipolytica TaxID=1856405 RepID=A0A1E8FD98_9ALTE|nr:DUF5610 domain-containing protein [Alteromonas lipolytica]OFI33558.1 hypothetical protein BFC17_04690 [Alteromonas lipolytica]GGF58671.1 hypothetical protein GCM10011338_08620 [Alteromonas lipolytica]